MGLRETITRWLRQDEPAEGDLREAEANAVEREYAESEAEEMTQFRLGARPGEFESDQEGPPR